MVAQVRSHYLPASEKREALPTAASLFVGRLKITPEGVLGFVGGELGLGLGAEGFGFRV